MFMVKIISNSVCGWLTKAQIKYIEMKHKAGIIFVHLFMNTNNISPEVSCTEQLDKLGFSYMIYVFNDMYICI